MTSRHQNAHSRATTRLEAVTWVGGSCGRHGSYVFYKAFRFRLAPPEPSTPNSSSGRNRTRRSLNSRSDESSEDAPERDGHASFNQERILSLGEFFFVQCRPEDPVCVGEIQLLWQDKHSGQDLASTRLYYLPETTPAGRTSQHGEDEMLAVSEKIVMRISDLASWIVEPQEWNYGSPLIATPPLKNGATIKLSGSPLQRYTMLHPCVNMSDVKSEKNALVLSRNGISAHQVRANSPEKVAQNGVKAIADTQTTKGEAPATPPKTQACCQARNGRRAEVIMLGMNAYCRHKAIMKRLRDVDQSWMSRPGARAILAALGAVTSENPKARVVFCRDTFDYPQLFEHDLICEELAPVFKGRPRKKNKKNGSLTSKSGNKKPSNGSKSSAVRSTESPVDLARHEAAETSNTPTRRSSQRRRSKRKSPQTISYEDHFLPASGRPSKRSRRTSARTPTPVSEVGGDKDTGSPSADLAASNAAGRGFISAATVAQTVDVVAQSSAVDNLGGRRKGKTATKRTRRRRSSATDLDIAIKNSLKINHKRSWSPDPESLAKKTSSVSDNSSRSSSPANDLLLPGNASPKASSSDGSSASSTTGNRAYQSSSSTASSPIDFAPASFASDKESEKSSPTPGANLLLHGLMDDGIPENKATFLDKLYEFMKKRNTPIGKIPSLGFKKLDLWTFFKLSQEFGGYDMVTAKRLWKHVYDRMGGNPSCTSAATCTRKHFEKLLLPFEMHLRQQLRNKEAEAREKRSNGSDETALGGSANSEILGRKEDPITQRTYNGDAYFINGAKTKLSGSLSSSILKENNILPETSKSTTNGFHDNKTPTTNSLPVSLPATSRPPAATTNNSAFVNLTTLAHNVICDEMMTSRSSPPAKNSPEDLSGGKRQNGEVPKAERTSPNARPFSNPGASVRAVPETNHVADNVSKPVVLPPTPMTSHMTNAQFSRTSVIVGARKVLPPLNESRSPAVASYRPPVGSSRYAGAPPPFVPTKSKPQAIQTVNHHPPIVHVDLTRTSHGVASSPEPRISDKSEIHRIQKRPLDDAHARELRMISPSSPKRSRPEIHHPLAPIIPPASSRNYDIRNLLLSAEKDHGKPFYPPSSMIPSRIHANSIKTEQPSHYSRIPPSETRQPCPNFVDPRRLDESQRPVIVKQDHVRPRIGLDPKRQVNGTSGIQLNRDGKPRPGSPQKQVDLSRESSATRKETYYRPNSMLSYRQQWQQKDTQQHQKDHHRTQVKEKPSPGMSNGVLRPSDHHQDKPNSFIPRPKTPSDTRFKREQDTTPRKPFSSSFSVDRLTSEPHKNHQYPSSNDSKPHVIHASPDASRNTPHHARNSGVGAYMKQPERKTSQNSHDSHMDYKMHHQDSRRVPSEFTNHHSKPDAHKRQQATVAPMPLTRSPVKDTSPLGKALSNLPPNAMYPKMLDQILQEAKKNMPGPHLASNALIHAEMQEALIRQQLEASPFRIITHQEQQAAAASQLARVARLGNPVAQPDPNALAIYQAYNQLTLRHMHEAASSSPAAQSLKLTQLGHALSNPLHFGGVSSHLIPTMRNPVFPAQPPHFSADVASSFGLPFQRR